MRQLIGKVRDANLQTLMRLACNQSKELHYVLGSDHGRIVVPASKKYNSGLEVLQKLGDRLLPEFGEGLLVNYPTRPLHLVYPASSRHVENNAVIVTIEGQARLITEGRDFVPMESGDCWRFDNRGDYQIEIESNSWWALFYFYLKPQSDSDNFMDAKLYNAKYMPKNPTAGRKR